MFCNFSLHRVTISGINTREWKHKTVDYKFSQPMNIGNKNWNTGVFKRKLETLARGKIKIVSDNISVQIRCKLILDRRDETRGMSSPQKSAGVFFI